MDTQTQTLTCKECGKTLPIDMFCRNKTYTSGHCNKCKQCSKKYSMEYWRLKKKDPEWIEKERARCREKERKFKWKRAKHTPEQRHKHYTKYHNKYPEKSIARGLAQYLPREKDKQNHHWSYRREDALSIIALTVEDHKLVHRKTIYDQERMMYRKLDGTLLDSFESALEYYKTIDGFSQKGQKQ